ERGGGVNYDGQDSYALNPAGWGTPNDPDQRLFETGNGLHTAVESSSRFRHFGTCGDGPCSWTMDDGAGRTYFFGDTFGGSSLWERFNGDVGLRGIFVWHLQKVVDLDGNSFRVEYQSYDENDAVNWYPSKIIYTTSEYPGAVPTKEVDFAYEPRP